MEGFSEGIKFGVNQTLKWLIGELEKESVPKIQAETSKIKMKKEK